MPDKGVLLVNLGTPESHEPGAVGRFLTEFLSDPMVVTLPRWLWLPLLKLVIIPLRKSKAAAAYKKVWMPQGSPLMVYSRALSDGLQDHLGAEVKVTLAMRYGRPGLAKGLSDLCDGGVEKLVVVPLYPQYSETTTGSVIKAVKLELGKLRWSPDVHFVEQYHDQSGWVHSVASSVRNFISQAGKPQKLLFSMHGLPTKMIEAGDPYERQCRQSFEEITEVLKMQQTCLLTYQSRVGREAWLQPYTDVVIRELAESGVKHIQVISPGFSVDCLETLEEIAIRYRDLFLKAGGEKFEYIPALNDSAAHISLLGSIVEQHLAKSNGN